MTGPADPRLARLLRWYPRAWRERYGEEFLALVEDTLGGRRRGEAGHGGRARHHRPDGRQPAGELRRNRLG
jgi:hypothetical protein